MKKYIPILLSTIFVFLMFVLLLNNFAGVFDNVENRMKVTSDQPFPTTIQLKSNINQQMLVDMLVEQNYVGNKEDAIFIAQHLTSKLNQGLTLQALYDLNKRVWQIPTQLIDSAGSKLYREKLAISRANLGITDSSFVALQVSDLKTTVTIDNNHSGTIEVYVNRPLPKANPLQKLLKKDHIACQGVAVRLSKHFLDSTGQPEMEILAYAQTNEKGEASFLGLDPNFSYSVLPIQDGYEYGTPKGTIGGPLSQYNGAKHRLTFSEKEHRIRVFNAPTLNLLKEEHAIIVRSPEDFRNSLTTSLSIFFIAWWALFFIFIHRRKNPDTSILAIIMALTGLSLLIMYSINDPLNDRLLGVDMVAGIATGIVIIGILIHTDFIKFYQNRSAIRFDIILDGIKWLFKPFRRRVVYLTDTLTDKQANAIKKCGALLLIVLCLPTLLIDLIQLPRLSDKIENAIDRLPKGSSFLILALLLTLLLFTPLGAEVGGMRVNLNIGILFQPSEIAKYLIIIFMAAFFSVNSESIIRYSQEGNAKFFGQKAQMLGCIILGLGFLMLLYLALGDMGPSMVLAFTFIILYSIIKSKVQLENLSENKQMQRILTCDIAMLFYGVISFVLFLYLGYLGKIMVYMCLAWFAIWVVGGIIIKKQVFESAILFNIIIAAFIIGPNVLDKVPGLDSIASRLSSRNEMCTNTWGTLGIDGQISDAGENTQVAEGLWGIASGGLFGQGLGDGSPHFIPAFHTDMILESIGEQVGFMGILVVILLLSMLLRKTITTGFNTTHPFAFYLCMGIAIVTAVQFIIIAFGSTGIIPLTGVTVPFFSYGKVSMILNLTAFGIVLSISRHNEIATTRDAEVAQLKSRDMMQYNYPVALLSLLYTCVAIAILTVFFSYQTFKRDETLIRPVFVNNSSGYPIVEYNPRIEQMTARMISGDIFDRNGILLATSRPERLSQYRQNYASMGISYSTAKRQSRYYPLGNHLYFMLGDGNTRHYFSSVDNAPRGYLAEARHLSDLRGYDNKLYDDNGQPVKVFVSSDVYRPNIFLDNNQTRSAEIQLRDYSTLLPYLKAGLSNYEISQMDEQELSEIGEIHPDTLQLTIDAQLQVAMQKQLENYINGSVYKNNTKLRASVVVLDASNGDLLTSAVYPLPDTERMLLQEGSYKDDNHPRGWKAYSDMDLGLTFATAPGSSAKTMSALAAFQAMGTEANKTFTIYESEIVANYETSVTGNIDMQRAIVRSSNCYFIKLINEYNLYSNLANIYRTVGTRISYNAAYSLFYNDRQNEKFENIILNETAGAVARYENHEKRTVLKGHPAWQWVYGQGTLDATPLSMARVAAIVGNNGVMYSTRYTLNDTIMPIGVVGKEEASMLGTYMQAEAAKRNFDVKSDITIIGGKTGTPQRGKHKKYDGWYVCYIKDKATGKKLAVAVRVERVHKGSGDALNFMRGVVIPTLKNTQYISK